MTKHYLFLLTLFGVSLCCNAQTDEKIKGNREVTIRQTYIDPFHTLVVGDEFEVELIYNSKPSVQVEADDNLHEHINFEVRDSILRISAAADIRSRKKMDIKVNYGAGFSHIETFGDGEVRSLTSLELQNATLKTSGSSKAYLNIKAKNFEFMSSGSAKVKLNLTADFASINFNDNTKVDALINVSELNMDLFQRASGDIEGTTQKLNLRLDNDAKFDGKNFTTNTCTLLAEFDSSATVEVVDSITIDSNGSSEIYLYGEPKITLNTFTGSSKLQKKEK